VNVYSLGQHAQWYMSCTLVNQHTMPSLQKSDRVKKLSAKVPATQSSKSKGKKWQWSPSKDLELSSSTDEDLPIPKRKSKSPSKQSRRHVAVSDIEVEVSAVEDEIESLSAIEALSSGPVDRSENEKVHLQESF
jgi:hypothetical protein